MFPYFPGSVDSNFALLFLGVMISVGLHWLTYCRIVTVRSRLVGLRERRVVERTVTIH